MKKVSKKVSFEKMKKKELANLKGGANSKGKAPDTLEEVTVHSVNIAIH